MKKEIEIHNHFLDGTIIIGSLKGVDCPDDLCVKLAAIINGIPMKLKEKTQDNKEER